MQKLEAAQGIKAEQRTDPQSGRWFATYAWAVLAYNLPVILWGAVVRVTGMNRPDLESCVEGVIKTIQFPSAKGGGVVQVNYPFTFQVRKENP